jgi:hypothetical protein
VGITPTPMVAECRKYLNISGLHWILYGIETAKNAEIRSDDRPDGHKDRPCRGVVLVMR